jgi:hypothetical protein
MLPSPLAGYGSRKKGRDGMCRTFLTQGGLSMPDGLGPRGETPRFVNLGDETCLVARRWGRGGLGIDWSRMAFGLRSRSGGVLSHAHLDRIEMLHGYEGIATNLCAVPLYGFRTHRDADWTKVRAGWALGSFDSASGFLLFSAGDGIAAPIVADWPDARRWLLSERWDQMRLLRAVADVGEGATIAEALRAF